MDDLEHSRHRKLDISSFAWLVIISILKARSRYDQQNELGATEAENSLTDEFANIHQLDGLGWAALKAKMEAYTPINDDGVIDDPAGIIRLWAEDNDVAEKIFDHPVAAMVIAMTYAKRAMALERTDRELAWAYIADACMWCGMVAADEVYPNALAKGILVNRKIQASAAATKRHKDEEEQVKKIVYHLAKECSAAYKKLPSRKALAEKVAKRLDGYVANWNKENINRPEMHLKKVTVRTIDKWLADFSDGGSLFSIRKK